MLHSHTLPTCTTQAQLIKMKTPCKPDAAVKAAAAKYKLKKPKMLSLVTMTGEAVTADTTKTFVPMQEFYLVRVGEDIADLELDEVGEPHAPGLPDELARLIFAFVPNQGNYEQDIEDLTLLQLNTVCKGWHRIVPDKFVGQGVWAWENVKNKARPWHPYNEDTNWCIEDGWRRVLKPDGKGGCNGQATVEIREKQKPGDTGKRMRLGMIDYTRMAQLNMKGSGKVINIRRYPRAWL